VRPGDSGADFDRGKIGKKALVPGFFAGGNDGRNSETY